MEGHLRSHRNERPFACTYEGCDKAYIQEKHLTQHIKGSHLHEKSYACDWEGCDKKYLTGQRLRRHVAAAHDGQGRLFQCTGYAPCTESFRKHQTLQRHIRSSHLELRKYPYTYIDPRTSVACNAAFDAPGSLRNHMDRQHKEPQFACDECFGDNDEHGNPQKLKFTTKALLTKHIQEEHVLCMFCNLKCSSQQSLQQHLESSHSGLPLAERKMVPCTEPGCGKSFTKKSNLNAHLKNVHWGEKFACGETDLRETTAGAWDGHDACGTLFASKANLADHVRTQHMGLPSTINAGRVKASGKTGAAKKKKKQQTSTIDELTGRAYREQQGRDISCAITACPYRFLRDYDHVVHLESHHMMTRHQAVSLISGNQGVSAENQEMMQQLLLHTREWAEDRTNPAADAYLAEAALSSNVNEPATNHAEVGFEAFDNDAEWALEQGAEEGGAFWLGDETAQEVNDDQWEYEHMEMQRLTAPSPEHSHDDSFWNNLDPSLR